MEIQTNPMQPLLTIPWNRFNVLSKSSQSFGSVGHRHALKSSCRKSAMIRKVRWFSDWWPSTFAFAGLWVKTPLPTSTKVGSLALMNRSAELSKCWRPNLQNLQKLPVASNSRWSIHVRLPTQAPAKLPTLPIHPETWPRRKIYLLRLFRCVLASPPHPAA